MGHRIRIELDGGDGEDRRQEYWKNRLLGVLVEMLCSQPEAPSAAASQQASRMEQIVLPGLFAVIEE